MIPSKPVLRAVVFDLDGTLLNCPYDFKAMRDAVLEIAAAHGLAKGELAGMGILEAIARGESLLSRDTAHGFRKKADEAVLKVEFAGAERSVPLDGAKDVLGWLKGKGILVGIITRNSRKIVRPLLQKAEFVFDALLAREDVLRVKPDPLHLREMLRLLKAGPEEALMVGDHIWDMACAKAAGLESVGITGGTSTREALIQAGADAVLERISLLPEWLQARLAPGPDHA